MSGPTTTRITRRASQAKTEPRIQRRLWPLLLAGTSLASGPALAVQLGDLDVRSGLGQPLRASIAYALSPNEQMHEYCISLRSGVTIDGLPVLSRAQLTVADGRINIVGRVPLNEPMLSVALTVNCPYTPHLTRAYTLMLDPVQPEIRFVAPIDAATASETTASPALAPAVRSAVPAPVAATPIGPVGEYRVQVGDSLSGIAARIADRPVGLWQAVDVLFRSNPDAFIDSDMNRLKAGSLLTIPSFDGVSAPQVAAEDAPSIGEPIEEPIDQTIADPAAFAPIEDTPAEEAPLTAYEPAVMAPVADVPVAVRDVATEAPSSDVVLETIEPAAAPEVEATVQDTLDQTNDLRPGDVQVGDDAGFVSPIDSQVNAEVDSDTTTAAPAEATDSRSGLYWLAATGIALILGFLVLGRRSRRRAKPPATPAPEQTIADDDPTTENRVLRIDEFDHDAERGPEVDFELGDDDAAQQAFALDADLSAGTGLKHGANLEVAQDFGFSATNDLESSIDLELPADDGDNATRSTDILPPQRVGEETILEREILPTDDDYDLSMVVDATRQRFGDNDVTAKDLMAVPVSGLIEEPFVDDYTVHKEVDYHILEQDYEEELTATQALNEEIAKAAIELADNLDDPLDGRNQDTEELAAVDEALDVTSEHAIDLEAGHADNALSDDDDTGINEQLTAELPVGNTTVEDPADTTATTELTADLPSAENDPTVEMEVESGRTSVIKSGG